MTDEEKKAIESFKEENNNDLSRFDDFNSYTQFKVKRDKIIIDLIEKQSKEIEELKGEVEKQKQYRKGLISISKKAADKMWEDKIKAKIEEYEKALNILLQKKEWIEPSDTIIRNKFMNYIQFGHSLLEKE